MCAVHILSVFSRKSVEYKLIRKCATRREGQSNSELFVFFFLFQNAVMFYSNRITIPPRKVHLYDWFVCIKIHSILWNLNHSGVYRVYPTAFLMTLFKVAPVPSAHTYGDVIDKDKTVICAVTSLRYGVERSFSPVQPSVPSNYAQYM